MTSNNEKALKQLANDYVNQYGLELLEENEQLKQQNTVYATPRADASVAHYNTPPQKRKKSRVPFFAAAAACLVLFVGSASIISNLPILEPTSTAASGDAAAPNNDYAQVPAPPSDTAESESPDLAEETMPPPPIIFTIPPQYSLIKEEAHTNFSVYTFNTDTSNQIILTIRYSSSDIKWQENMDLIAIDGEFVHTTTENSTLFLLFESQEYLYELSTTSDLDSILPLYRSIVSEKN